MDFYALGAYWMRGTLCVVSFGRTHCVQTVHLIIFYPIWGLHDAVRTYTRTISPLIEALHDAVRTYTSAILPRSLVSFLYVAVWRKTTKPTLLLIYFITRFEISTEYVFNILFARRDLVS